MKVRVYSIFNSIDGEVNRFHQGHMSTFIRLAGCNLTCGYCDTKYAQDVNCGKFMEIEEVLRKINSIGCKKVTFTGGEPLLQNIQLAEMLIKLDKLKYMVTVETNGSLSPFQTQLKNVSYVMDWKLPSSGMENYMRMENFMSLRRKDFIKFVIFNDKDFERSLSVLKEIKNIGCEAKIAFSPVHKEFDVALLVEKLQKKKIFNVVINLQLHKYIWPLAGETQER